MSLSPPAEPDHAGAILAASGLAGASDSALVLALAPRRLIHAGAALAARLGAVDAADLERRLLTGEAPGARRLRDLCGALAPGAPPRLERLRFYSAGRPDVVTLSVRRVGHDGRAYLVAVDPAAAARAMAAPPAPAAVVAAPPPQAEAAPLPETDRAPPPAADTDVDRGGADAPAAAARPTRAARFVWESDAAHRFVAIGAALRSAVGATGDVAGRPIADVIAAYGLDPEGRIAAALERQATWSALRLAWPVAGGGAAAPVDLFGAPAFDRARRFVGFRGFGVVRPERLPLAAQDAAQAGPDAQAASDEAAPDQAVEPPALAADAPAPANPARDDSPTDEAAAALFDDAAPAAPEAETVFEADAPGAGEAEAEAGTTDEEAAAIDAEAAVRENENRETEADEDADAAPAPEDFAPGLPGPTAYANDDAATTPPAAAAPLSAGPLHNVVSLRPNQPPLHALTRLAVAPDATTPAEPARPAPPKADAPTADAPAPETGAPATAPAAPPPVPALPAPRGPAASVELSAAEKQAFRDIARSLGARPIEERRDPLREATPAPPAAIPPPARRDVMTLADESEAPVAAPGADATPAPSRNALATPRDLLAAELARNGSTMLDRMPVGLMVARGDRPLYANRTLLDLIDFDSLADLERAGGLAHMFRGREPARLADSPEGGAIPLATRSGEALAVDVRIQKIDWEGEPASMLTVRRSLDGELGGKVKTLEMELRARQSEARELHTILDTATDGVVVLDEEGRILALNRSAEALFGYDQNEVAGDNFALLFAPQSQRSAADYLDGLKSNGVASVLNDGREVIGRERQGGSIPLFMTIGRISTAGPAKFCAVLRDMTHWKKAERQLEQARRDAERASSLKSDFLAKISHEIRTPLNAILGFAEVIMDERFGPIGNARYKDYLKDIHASGAHVMSLVNDLLDLSKIEAGKLELAFGAVDANRIVTECVSLMQAQALQERVILRVSLAPRLPQIVADERSLRQIVLNLLSNAVKFNEPGGQVIVSTALTDAGHAVIRIRDTGIGMSEDEIEIALEPFRQIATARPRSGTGLGLPLTKALVEANRASFTIKSKKREGTLIEIAFPPTRVLAE